MSVLYYSECNLSVLNSASIYFCCNATRDLCCYEWSVWKIRNVINSSSSCFYITLEMHEDAYIKGSISWSSRRIFGRCLSIVLLRRQTCRKQVKTRHLTLTNSLNVGDLKERVCKKFHRRDLHQGDTPNGFLKKCELFKNVGRVCAEISWLFSKFHSLLSGIEAQFSTVRFHIRN